MNKYLLLRDNKQTGPYTVQEIIDKGMKPYDLVWLEGKSAAWRYPSEIEELKEYAPAIEEQPYDRFYKKPETAVTETRPEKKSVFEPVVVEEQIKKKMDTSSKKVYINFPGGVQKKSPVIIAKKQIAEEKKEPIMPVQTFPVQPVVDVPVVEENPSLFVSAPVSQPPNRKMFYGIAAACFVLILFISVLIINYGNQRGSIKKLNEMVQQMEKKQYEQNQAAKAALASRVIPASSAVTDESSASKDPIVSAEPDKNISSERSSLKPSPAVLSADPMTAPVKTIKKEKQAGTTTTVKESKVVENTAKTGTGSNENLYKQVSVKSNKYKTGLFGGISGLQFVLTNNSAHELQRVAVEVQYFAPEKKLIKTQTVYFENVAPGAQPVIDVPKSARGVTIDYKITDIK